MNRSRKYTIALNMSVELKNIFNESKSIFVQLLRQTKTH